MPFYKFEILSTYKNIEHLNQQLKAIYKSINITQKDIAELEIVYVEALNNIVKHAYLEDPNQKIIVELSIVSSFWNAKLIDFGIPRRNFDVPNLDFNPDDIDSLPESGMGLFLIHKLTDSAKYLVKDSCNEFHLEKFLTYETNP